MPNIEGKIEILLTPIIHDLGYEIYDVEYAKEGKDFFLRIYIDKPEGIDIQDCEKVNDAINDLLDEANYIKESYYLEVSSPGIERNLRKEKHFEENIGKNIEIRLFKPIDGQKSYHGILKGFDVEQIIISQEGREVSLPRKNIAVVKTVYDW